MKNRFSRWPPWRPSWIFNRNDFSHFWSISHPDASYQVSSQLAFGFSRRSEKKDFQNGHHCGHLGFPISRILAIFDLQVTLILPTKFGVNWPFGAGNEVKNRFSRWRPWQPSWISDQNNFSYFWSTSHPNSSYQVLSFERKTDFQDGCHLGLPIGTILASFDLQVIPMLPSKFGVNSPSVQEKKQKINFHMAAMVAILDFWSAQF